MLTVRVSVMAACASGAWAAGASANIVVNGSFESATRIGQINAVDSATLGGWRVAAGSIDLVEFWQASDGVRSVDLTGNSLGRLEQDLPTTPGERYEVRFDMAANTNQTPPGIFSLRLSAAGADRVFNFNRTVDLTISSMGYQERVWEFTAIGTTTTLAFSSLTNVLNGGPVVDNVRVTEVPAPAGAALLPGLAWAARRRRRSGP